MLLADARGPDGSLELQTAGLHQQVRVIRAENEQDGKSLDFCLKLWFYR